MGSNRGLETSETRLWVSGLLLRGLTGRRFLDLVQGPLRDRGHLALREGLNDGFEALRRALPVPQGKIRQPDLEEGVGNAVAKGILIDHLAEFQNRASIVLLGEIALPDPVLG